FKYLIQNLEWSSFENFIKEKYKYSIEELPSYKKFIDDLKNMDINNIKEKGTLFLSNPYPGDEGSSLSISIRMKDSIDYAIDFLPWEEVLAAYIDMKSLVEHGVLEFVYQTLYDMSFDGFDYNTRKENIDNLVKRIE